ncbi:KOW domain-containing RNA-binding protein [Granulicella aggregans]|uniref:hypothetical protein n=1 Tax=Granulicella aggregans TaxID=474949 RepID=UPI0021DF8355|nr:hypothetical protein [Granulicella aggregans]
MIEAETQDGVQYGCRQSACGGNSRPEAAARLLSATRRLTMQACMTLAPVAIAILALPGGSGLAFAQATAPSRQIGTVKQVTPNKLIIANDAGQSISVSVVDGAKVLQLSPGSTDLKTALAISLADIETGDRVLVTGHQDAPDAMTVSRVILMKSTDIAQKNEAEQADWQKRGTGGLVSAVDPASGTITISSRGKKIAVETQPSTVYRRYSNGSVKFSDAVVGTRDQIQVGDQLRARGEKSVDGGSIKAEEIVSGAFENLAGTVTAIDAASQTFTLTDISTKKSYSIAVTANSSLRALPPDAAARFAARARGGDQSAGGAGADKPKLPPAAAVAVGDPHSEIRGAGTGSAGGDLSQLVNRLPQGSLSDLHTGEVLMVVAEKTAPGGDGLIAITVLSGVEPILIATPKGTASMTLSPWNFGGGQDGGGA